MSMQDQVPSRYEGDVPAELVELILSAVPGYQPAIYKGLYEGFPLPGLPDGFSVLGSVDQGSTCAAFLRSPLPPGESETVVAAVLEGQGWQRLPDAPMMARRQQSGFVARGAPGTFRPPVTFCLDGQGTLSLSGSAGRHGPVLTLRHTPAEMLQGQSCAQLIGRRGQAGMHAYPDIARYMPRLEVPEQQRQVPALAAIRGGLSSSGNRVQTSTNLDSAWAPDALYAHFAAQLREQGWREEGGWQGGLSAGGHWLREVDTDTRLSGLLTVLRGRGNHYQLNFQLQSR